MLDLEPAHTYSRPSWPQKGSNPPQAPRAGYHCRSICEKLERMRWGTLLLGALSFCLLASCSFESRSSAFACDVEGNCPNDRVCEMGWCVVPGSNQADANPLLPDANLALPDANLALPDAAPPEADAMPPACLACEGGTCTEDCTITGDCAYDCSVDACNCSFSCTADADKCNGECKANTTCSVDCGGAKQCHPKCKPGAICDFDCTSVSDCKRAQCEGDAQCILNCTGTTGNNCKFDICGGVEMSCPGNILVCGRDCP